MARTRRDRSRRRSRPAGAPAVTPAGAPPAAAPAPPRAHQGRQAAAAARRAGPGPIARAGAAVRHTRAALGAQPVAAAVGLAITLGAFGLYLATAARDIAFGDTPELTAAALTAG